MDFKIAMRSQVIFFPLVAFGCEGDGMFVFNSIDLFAFLCLFFHHFRKHLVGKMAKGLIWATAEDLSRNRGRVLSLYRQVLRSLNSPDLPLNLAARLHRKAQARAIFMVAAEERSIHNIKDLIDIAEYSLSLLRKGEIPKYIQ
ncbi:hypothetical protein QVD17_20378 [Tagetes erecta]|uniref:LYR motif containing domain-containing protein n=1 Tax=Tagetes erecta TaxID=13708 RepID=A0AAD8KSQ8_TARER|nr:hypothetical protein QVD17_20378 [Tagetes erecta]